MHKIKHDFFSGDGAGGEGEARISRCYENLFIVLAESQEGRKL
jgi:hypothetical protein